MKLVEYDAASDQTVERDLTAEESAQHDRDTAALAARAQADAQVAAKRDADEQAWRDAVRNASSLAGLKDVLLGTNLATQADVRPKNSA